MFDEEFRKVPAEPPRRVESLPGLRLRGIIPRWAVVLLLFFVMFFLFIPLSVMNADPAMRLRMGATRTVQGHVVSVGSASACRGNVSHRLVYVFSATGGGEHRGVAVVCEESALYSAKEGDAIDVRYLESDPTVSVLPSELRNDAPPFAFFLFPPLFFLTFFVAMFWPPIGAALRARRLFKTGRLATGKVIFVKRRASFLWPGMTGGSAAQVFVEIPSAGGGSREVVAPCQNEWLLHQLTPGSSVHVAYSGEDAKEVALLDGYLR